MSELRDSEGKPSFLLTMFQYPTNMQNQAANHMEYPFGCVLAEHELQVSDGFLGVEEPT